MEFVGWSIENLETNIRNALALLIFLLIAWQGIKSYGKGQKGKALIEIVLGVVISLFIIDSEAAKALGEGLKKLLGFSN